MGRSLSAFNGPDLTPREEAVAMALASGRSLQETASDVGVGETTVKRWLRNPGVVQRARELRADLTSRAAGILADAMSVAEFNAASPVSRRRATRVEMEERAEFLINYAADHGPDLRRAQRGAPQSPSRNSTDPVLGPVWRIGRCQSPDPISAGLLPARFNAKEI